MLNILIPMAGRGSRFQEAGYTFPKPLIDVNGKTMIEVVIENLRPKVEHQFIFVCRKEHYEKYDLHNILKRATKEKFEVALIDGDHPGAVCAALTAIQYINNDDDLLIANADQFIENGIDDFLKTARDGDKDGLIMTFKNSHPKWSYARLDGSGRVIETAEKKLISDNATVGLYYFRKGSDFVRAGQSMIAKDIRHNNEFYVCPTYNELILEEKNIYTLEIPKERMHGLGTPEDLQQFLKMVGEGKVQL
ncbi:MAG: glycosyltransferase family 2 protein [Candidatus Brennerbacteria bacterium]